MNEELANIYNSAKAAIADDLKNNLYNATEARVQAFRQLNNNANAKHALYSGMPSATQMQYDRETYLPNAATMAVKALAKQQQNQENWDSYMNYVKELNEQADYYNNLANQLGGATSQYQKATASTNSAYSNFSQGN